MQILHIPTASIMLLCTSLTRQRQKGSQARQKTRVCAMLDTPSVRRHRHSTRIQSFSAVLSVDVLKGCALLQAFQSRQATHKLSRLAIDPLLSHCGEEV